MSYTGRFNNTCRKTQRGGWLDLHHKHGYVSESGQPQHRHWKLPRRAGSAPVVGSHVMLARNWASGINFLAKLWLDMRLCNYYRDQTGHNFTPHQINFVVLKVNICNLIVPTLPKDCDIRASHHNHTQSKCLPPSWLRRTRRLFSPTMALRSL